MTTFITGATGFIGSCLARRLVHDGHTVHVSARSDSNRWRYEDLKDGLTEHTVDLRNAGEINAVIGKIRPRVIYHCATYGGFAEQNDFQAIMTSNVIGTVNLLRACENVGFDYFVNTGSSSEYGLKSSPMSESDILEPVSDYGVSKAAATLYCSAEGRIKKLPIVTLRLFSPYGPWDDPRRMIPYAIASLLCNTAPKLASPHSVRDYVYIDDVIDAYISVVQKSLPGHIINIGGGEQHPIGEVVACIEHAVKSESRPAWGAAALKRPEPVTWTADITKAYELIGWRPKVTMQRGIEQTVAWMRGHISQYV